MVITLGEVNMKINKKARFVSILIGLLLIGLIVYKFITVDMKNPIVYHDSFPEIVNTISLYAVLAIKILTVILISIGNRGTIISGVFLMAIMLAEVVFVNWERFMDINELFKAQPLNQFFNLLGTENYIYLGLIGSFSIFWLLFAIFALGNKLMKKAVKIVLFIISLLPFAITFQLVMEDNFKIDLADPIYGLTVSVSIIFFTSLMIMLTQREPKKPKGKHIWVPVIETM